MNLGKLKIANSFSIPVFGLLNYLSLSVTLGLKRTHLGSFGSTFLKIDFFNSLLRWGSVANSEMVKTPMSFYLIPY